MGHKVHPAVTGAPLAGGCIVCSAFLCWSLMCCVGSHLLIAECWMLNGHDAPNSIEYWWLLWGHDNKDQQREGKDNCLYQPNPLSVAFNLRSKEAVVTNPHTINFFQSSWKSNTADTSPSPISSITFDIQGKATVVTQPHTFNQSTIFQHNSG